MASIDNTNPIESTDNTNPIASTNPIVSTNPMESVDNSTTTQQLAKTTLFDLPELSLHIIYSYVGLKQLTYLAFTCRRAYICIAHANSIWKYYCKIIWLKTESNNSSWLTEFRAMYAEYGQFMDCYAPILLSWQRIYNKLKQTNVDDKKLFAPGATKQELDDLENRLECKLPKDFRFFLATHNGQIKPEKNDHIAFPQKYFFFGTYLSFYDVIDAYSYLLSTKDIHKANTENGCITIQFTANGQLQTYALCIKGNDTIETGEVLHLITEKNAISIGTNFTQWFTKFSMDMENFPIDEGYIKRYYSDPNCIATTNNIEVKVCTALSNINLSRYYNHRELLMIYHITISMDKSIPNTETAKLETRHWLIKNSKGENTVDGPGVVGYYPTMKPGEIFTYTSGNYVSGNWSTMEGHFTFRHLKNQHTFNVIVPQFNLIIPTIKNM